MRMFIFYLTLMSIISISIMGCSIAPSKTNPEETIVQTPAQETQTPAQEIIGPKSIEGSMILKNNQYVGDSTDNPIILKYNPESHDPTWAEVSSFLYADNTDAHPYYPDSYVCANYAAQFYENAQKRGLRCAYVVLNGINHALNAFNTTDRGFVYVDYTGKQYNPKVAFNGVLNYKKIAYVQEGNEYGLISFDTVLSNKYGFDYQTYVDWHARAVVFEDEVDDFVSDVDRYNDFTQDRVFINGSEEYEKAKSWQQELESTRTRLLEQGESIGPIWDLSEYGVVTTSEIFWKGYGQ